MQDPVHRYPDKYSVGKEVKYKSQSQRDHSLSLFINLKIVYDATHINKREQQQRKQQGSV